MSDTEEQLQQSENSPLNSELRDEESRDGTDSTEPELENEVAFVETETAQISINEPAQEKLQLTSIEGELDFEDEVAEADPERKEEESFEKSDTKDGDSDEGQCTPEKEQTKDDVEEGEDDGEITDDGDLEEGELRENSPTPKQPTRQICRFYSKGQCTWGNVCRFLHLSGNEKGNYNMFASPTKHTQGFGGGHSGPSSNHRSGRGGLDFIPSPPRLVEPTALESAWERGLKQAKEMVKKANKRKEEEPDFDEKRLNLSLQVNEKNIPDHSKEKEKTYKKNNRRHNDSYKVEEEEEEPELPYDNGDREMKENWRGGRYENFEVRWTREEAQREQRDRERSRGGGRVSRERDRYSRNNRSKEKWRDNRTQDVQPRTRAEVWMDPWRRSKSPKGNRLSRSRSGSYSSLSSYTYSERGSSRSSGSYSRSSSRSSTGSRSPSQQKRKPSPRAAVAPVSQKKPEPKRFNTITKKPGDRVSSSRSRSPSHTPSPSRSRSYSRSISMDSVSSASSSISRSSSGSGSVDGKNKHVSILKKQDEKAPAEKPSTKTTVPLSSLYPEVQASKIPKFIKQEPVDSTDIDTILLEQEKTKEAVKANPFPSLQHLLPSCDKVKEPVKGLHKQQIKLTLLNKAPPSKTASFQKKDDSSKTKTTEESSKPATGIKRPLSPTSPVAIKPATVVAPKKSASSRRDELLKQLKAVEDAIARKRSKI